MTAQKKILDLTGVQHLVQTIKGIVSGINTAISSKANDSEVLHKAQTETVTGEKTFKKDVKIIDLNANERPGVQFEVNGSFRTFEDAKDSLPDTDFGDFGGGILWSGWVLDDNTKIQNSMSNYVINDITFGTANYSSVMEFNNYYKVTYEDDEHNSPTDLRGMLRFELAPYENVEKDHEYWSDPNLYFYAMLDGEDGNTILGHSRAPWSKAYIGEINCEDIKFGGIFSIFDVLNNIQNLSYVFRYSSTALVASSTNSNTLLDNTDNLKVGDKVIDSNGVLFSITAIDSVNSTFTIGSALIDLALDANVVHTSGNETVGGNKTFTGEITNNISNKANTSITLKNSSYDPKTNGQSNANSSSFSISFNTLTDDGFAYITAYGLPEYSMLRLTTTYFTDSENSITDSIEYKIYQNGDRSLRPRNNNNCLLGETSRRWSKVYATNYYYGSNSVEFSNKFVTTDTAQTISGSKTFSSNTLIYNSDNTANTPNLILQSSKIQLGDTSNSDSQGLIFNAGNSFVSKVDSFKDGSGTQNLQNHVRTKDASNNVITAMYRLRLFNSGLAYLESSGDNTISLGGNNAKWKDCQTYLINGLTPSSLSLPSGTLADQIDISGYFTNTGSGDTNSYTALANGWIYLRLGDISSCQATVCDSNNNRIWGQSSTGSVEQLTIPILKGQTLSTQWNTSSSVNVANAKFIPCQGNI